MDVYYSEEDRNYYRNKVGFNINLNIAQTVIDFAPISQSDRIVMLLVHASNGQR